MPRYRHPRRSLTWAEWPATDRAAWETAIATGDILDGQGPEGQPLTAHSIYGRILLVSRRLLGVAINPHLLRDCAATSLSTVSPAAALAAAALLGHRRFATTERHYIRAHQLEAGRTINAVLAKLLIGVE